MQEFTGKEYLMIDIANNYGLDKKPWNQRIQWVKDHENELLNHLKEAESPALYYAGVKALEKVKEGKPIGYPISLDATASGIQILSCVLHDRKAASHCNVINTGNREDVYTSCYKKMCDKIGDTAKIEREQVKKAIMTSFYSSEAVPKAVFGEGLLYETFQQVMAEEMPYLWEANKVFIELWPSNKDVYSWVLPDNFHAIVKVLDKEKEVIHWLNEPKEIIRDVQKPKKKGRSLSANCVHSYDAYIVREICRRCMYNPEKVSYINSLLYDYMGNLGSYKKRYVQNTMVETLWNYYKEVGILSARIIDYISDNTIGYIDEPMRIQELINSCSRMPFQVLSIHDCYRVHPNYGNDIRKLYIRLLWELSKSNILEYNLRQITGNNKLQIVFQDNISNEILNSEYALS